MNEWDVSAFQFIGVILGYSAILVESAFYGVWGTVVWLFQFSVCLKSFLNFNILFSCSSYVSLTLQ